MKSIVLYVNTDEGPESRLAAALAIGHQECSATYLAIC